MGSYPPPPKPEFLPPDSGFNPPPPPVRRPRPSWAVAPATYLLLVMLANHVSYWSPTSEQLFRWGADNAGAVLIGGEWWRIVTAMFVHVGILHLATNMWCLWNLGLLAEPLMGSGGLLAVYVLTGAAGNLLSTFVNWLAYHDVGGAAGGVFPVGAGASGAVFGIAGALIVLLKSHRLPVPPTELKRLRKSVIYFAALNLVLGLSIWGGNLVVHSGLNIDNMAHLGGCPLVPRIGSPKELFVLRLRIAIVMVVGVLVLFGFYLAQLPG